jgi:hypothetical protein
MNCGAIGCFGVGVEPWNLVGGWVGGVGWGVGSSRPRDASTSPRLCSHLPTPHSPPTHRSRTNRTAPPAPRYVPTSVSPRSSPTNVSTVSRADHAFRSCSSTCPFRTDPSTPHSEHPGSPSVFRFTAFAAQRIGLVARDATDSTYSSSARYGVELASTAVPANSERARDRLRLRRDDVQVEQAKRTSDPNTPSPPCTRLSRPVPDRRRCGFGTSRSSSSPPPTR